jgi:hypothetical protein
MKGNPMSRVYFHTQTRTAEIMGSERGWLRSVATNAARTWWGLDDTDPLDRALDIANMIVPDSPGQYVRARVDTERYAEIESTSNHATLIKDYANQAIDDRSRYQETWKRYSLSGADPIRNVHYNQSNKDALIDVLRTCLRVTDVPLQVGDHVVYSANVELNTALATGNYAVCLAAKIHGWCEIHPWIEEGDRDLFADLIEDAILDGVYRSGLWYTEGDGQRTWHDQGWADVMALLRDVTTHPGPVVLSYSVCEEFPNAYVSTQMPPWPTGVPETWDALTTEQQDARRTASLAWYDLPEAERWDTAMAGIRNRNPWANLTPENLAITTFGPGVTLFDLFHPDRVDRVKAAFTRDREIEEDEERDRATQSN